MIKQIKWNCITTNEHRHAVHCFFCLTRIDLRAGNTWNKFLTEITDQLFYDLTLSTLKKDYAIQWIKAIFCKLITMVTI